MKEGDYLAGPYSEDGLRFVYHIGLYEGSLNKPYIYRQVGDGPLEVVGRANQEIDLTRYEKISNQPSV